MNVIMELRGWPADGGFFLFFFLAFYLEISIVSEEVAKLAQRSHVFVDEKHPA